MKLPFFGKKTERLITDLVKNKDGCKIFEGGWQRGKKIYVKILNSNWSIQKLAYVIENNELPPPRTEFWTTCGDIRCVEWSHIKILSRKEKSDRVRKNYW